MAGAKIALSAVTGELRTDGNDNARTNLPTNILQTGYVTIAGENHDGAAGGAAQRRSVYISPEKRLGVGMDSILFEDFFSHTVFNSRKYTNLLTTMTTALAGGFMTFNAGLSVATTVGDLVRSYRTFPMYGNFPQVVDFGFSLSLAPQANNFIAVGVGVPGTATVASTDGIFMVIDSAGALSLNCYYNNATPTTSGTLPFTWTANRVYHGEIIMHRDRAEMFIDGVFYGAVARSSANTAGALTQSQTGNLIAHLINTGVTSGAQKLNLAWWSVSAQDGQFQRPIGVVRAGMGESLLSVPDGVAVAQLTNGANSAAPATQALSNTAASYSTLGGNFQFAAVVGAETDYALFAYQVPAGAIAAPGKNMFVTGVIIDTWNMGAAAAVTPTLLDWTLGIGSTAVSLATADAVTTRGPHRVGLGAQSIAVGAAIGARADRFVSERFPDAYMVEAGSFVHIILRMPVGTATASQVIRGKVSILGYFE